MSKNVAAKILHTSLFKVVKVIVVFFIAYLFVSCAETKHIIVKNEPPKPTYFNNYGINRLVRLTNRGFFVNVSTEKNKDVDVSECTTSWQDGLKEVVSLRKIKEDIQIEKITYDDNEIIGLKGLTISKIVSDLKIEQFELIQNDYTNGIIYLKNMFPKRQVFAIFGNKNNAKKDEKSVLLFVVEVNKNNRLNLLKTFRYYNSNALNAQSLSYDNDGRVVIAEGGSDTGHIEIYADDRGRLKDVYYEGETDYD